MKTLPFDIEKALAGHPCVTRGGTEVSSILTGPSVDTYFVNLVNGDGYLIWASGKITKYFTSGGDILLVDPYQDSRILTAVIHIANKDDFYTLKGIYIQAGVDVTSMDFTPGWWYVEKNQASYSSNSVKGYLPRSYISFDSLTDYLDNKPTWENVTVVLDAAASAVIKRDTVTIYRTNEWLTLDKQAFKKIADKL